MDEIVRMIGFKNNCTFCGVFRRQALDRGAAMLKVDKLVTGHNADDIAETMLLNILRGDIARLSRCTLITTGEDGPIPRCKPFKYTYEKKIVMNVNNGATGEGLKVDLLNHPEYIEQNATLAFQAAIWRWMTPIKKGQPSAHQAFCGEAAGWKPTKNDTLSNRITGFGTTMNVLYGDQLCGQGEDVQEMNTIITHYLYYADKMGIGREKAGLNVSCGQQKAFNPTKSTPATAAL